MKTPWTITAASGCLAAAVLLTACSEQPSCCPPPTKSAAPEKPMHPVVGQLDLDGDFLLHLNTSTIESYLFNYVDTVVSMTESAAGPAEAALVASVASQVKHGLEWSGLFSLDSFSMSMKEIDENLNRMIAIGKYDAADAQKAIWRILASEPTALQGIQYAPADAVYTLNSTASLSELWNVLNEAMEAYLPPEAAKEVPQQMAMIEMMLGTTLEELTGSLDNEILFSIQLSETKTCAIPVGMEPLVIPEPGLLIGLKTKNPAVSQLLLSKLKEAQAPMVESKHGDYTLSTLNLPIPMPVPVSPTLVQTEDYLLIGSSLETVTRAIDSRASQSGLAATPLYRKLLAEAPEKTSGIEFLSPRLLQTYIDAVISVVESTSGPEEIALIKLMIDRFKSIQSGSYLLKTADGFYSHTLGDYGPANPGEIVASVGTGYIGLMAAIAIPSFHKARVNSIEKSCTNNMRIFTAAKEQWAMENNKADGDTVTGADISDWIKGGFESLQCPGGGTYLLGTIGFPPNCSEHGTSPH